jgi:hypothetical protein
VVPTENGPAFLKFFPVIFQSFESLSVVTVTVTDRRTEGRIEGVPSTSSGTTGCTLVLVPTLLRFSPSSRWRESENT